MSFVKCNSSNTFSKLRPLRKEGGLFFLNGFISYIAETGEDSELSFVRNIGYWNVIIFYSSYQCLSSSVTHLISVGKIEF